MHKEIRKVKKQADKGFEELIEKDEKIDKKLEKCDKNIKKKRK